MAQGYRNKDGSKLGFQKGYKQTDIHKERIGNALKGRLITDQTKIKISEKNKSKNKENQFWKFRNPNHPNLIRTQFKKGIAYPYTRISKPQIELYKIVKLLHPDAKLNFSIITKKTVRYADIGIPSIKMDIEYNAPYWHQDHEKDWKREQELKEVGWSVFIVEDDKGLEAMREWISEILLSRNTQ